MSELLVRRAAVLTERKFRPVKLWAGIGVVALVIQAVAYAGWFLSGEFVSTPTGDTPIPTQMIVAIRVWEVLAVIGSALMVWFVLVKPWRRDGRISLDGMFVLVMITVVWQDVLCNLFQTFIVYNSGFVNRGSW
jgi:hypothetical protein